MNWNYLQEWAISLMFFAPALVILALAILALPLAKGNQFTAAAEKLAAAKRSRNVEIHVTAPHAASETVAEETA